MNTEIILVFIIVAFSLAFILIMKKDTLPDPLRKPLAIMAVIMVTIAFGFMIYSFFATAS